ncbi:MAG TPA: hypothetical protein VEJ84_00185, partial [Acidimicrobiales bacterium]|nr:hypothetical protein [Acidimicrobiales bacterium]
DGMRRSLLGWVAGLRGRALAPSTTSFAAHREARLDALGDLVAGHLDTARVSALIENGAPRGLPTLRSGPTLRFGEGECCVS